MAKNIKKIIPPAPHIAGQGSREQISFSFENLQEYSYTDARNDSSFFISFLERLQKLCCLGWTEIAKSQRHAFGFETIKVSALNKRARNRMNQYPDITKLYCFRATGDNHVFLGYRTEGIFNVLFIEYAFNDVYQH